MKHTITFSAMSHTGNVRENNEDNLFCMGKIIEPQAGRSVFHSDDDAKHSIFRSEDNDADNLTHLIRTNNAIFTLSDETVLPCIFAVCDGMGGHEDGEFASYTVAKGITELEATLKNIPESISSKTPSAPHSNKAVNKNNPDTTIPPKNSNKIDSLVIDSLVQEYITKANDTICAKMREKSVRMGTTIALVVLAGNEVKLYGIGDSRIYELSNDKLIQVSNDHTMAEQKVSMGIITKEQARHDRDRNKLTRYLGIFEDEMIIEAEPFQSLDMTEVRRILICTDGLTDMVTDEKIEEILKTTPIHDAARMLVEEAIECGGKDNVTCIVIDIAPQPATSKKKQPGKFAQLLSRIANIGSK